VDRGVGEDVLGWQRSGRADRSLAVPIDAAVEQRSAELAGGDHAACLRVRGVVPALEADLQADARGSRGRHDTIGSREGRGDGLLHEHVFAGGDRPEGVLLVRQSR
jgi:hypothetical protein